MKRVLVLLLVLAMTFGLGVQAFGVMPTSSILAGEDIYFSNGYGSVSQWRVVEDNATDLVLLSVDANQRLLEQTMIFDITSNVWGESEIRTYINTRGHTTPEGAIRTGFLDIFTKAELEALTAADDTSADKVTLPTMAQVLDGKKWGLTEANRKRNHDWWLRDAVDGQATFVRAIKADGTLNPDVVHVFNNKLTIAPVIRLDKDKIAFAAIPTEDNVFGSEFMAPFVLQAGQKKLVIKDHENLSVARATQSHKPILTAGDEISIRYKNAMSESLSSTAGTYKSMIVAIMSEKTTGNMIHYGMPGEFISPGGGNGVDGTVRLRIPTDYDDTRHEIKIYVENVQVKGSTSIAHQFTNYISTGIPLTYEAAPLPKHTLTVDGNGSTGSTGTGTYEENKNVTIYAGTMADRVFDKWTYTTIPSGINVDVASLTSATTTVKMPAGEVLMTANWKAPLPKHTLTVDGNGSIGSTGTGTYEANKKVTIYAGTMAGNSFKEWTYITTPSGISVDIASLTSATTIVTMPAGEVLMIANWEDPPIPPPITFPLTVIEGGFDSAGTGDYNEGAIAGIYAGTKSGYTFSHWTYASADGVVVVIENPRIDTTTLKMPANNVIVTAHWTKNPDPPVDPVPPVDPPTPPIIPPNDDSDYEEPPRVTITTEPERIPPMSQEPFAVEPPNAETGGISNVGIAIKMLFASGLTCVALAGFEFKKKKK